MKLLNFIKTHKLLFILLSVSLATSTLLRLLINYSEPFPEWYATTIYPIYINTISRLLSPFPYSVSEILLIILITYLLLQLIFGVHGVIRRKKKVMFPTAICTFLLRIFTLISILFTVYTLTCGINYHRTAFSNYLGFKTETSSTEELKSLCLRLVKMCNNYSSQIPIDKNGLCILPENANEIAVKSMRRLGTTYKTLAGYYPNPKPLLFSEFMSYQFLTGIYSPFTVEANYNNHMPASNIPQTMCHELSHLRGFMREDEAEFISYLACIGSDNVVFKYSGSLTALSYCMNALYRDAGATAYKEIYNNLSSQVKTQLQYDYQYWDKYRGTIADIQDKVNDTYLKANSQTDGVKSYGRMIDLLLAYYKNR
jgi:hypothetical protein